MSSIPARVDPAPEASGPASFRVSLYGIPRCPLCGRELGVNAWCVVPADPLPVVLCPSCVQDPTAPLALLRAAVRNPDHATHFTAAGGMRWFTPDRHHPYTLLTLDAALYIHPHKGCDCGACRAANDP